MNSNKRQALLVGLATVALALVGASNAAAQTADEILAQFDNEPTILEVQEATAEYALISQGSMESWSTRATASAVLPEVRVTWTMTNADDLQNDVNRDFDVINGEEILTQVDRNQRIEDDDDIRLRLQGDWNLNELVYNPDILRVSNETSDLVELREDLLTRVTSLYYERRRAQVQMLMDPPSDAVERLRRQLEVQELTAGIDGMTGGWFSATLSESGTSSY